MRMTRKTAASRPLTLAVLVCFLVVLGFVFLHHHDDPSHAEECPACLWVQAVGGSQVPEAPAIMPPEPVLGSILETDEIVPSQDTSRLIPPRSPPVPAC